MRCACTCFKIEFFGLAGVKFILNWHTNTVMFGAAFGSFRECFFFLYGGYYNSSAEYVALLFFFELFVNVVLYYGLVGIFGSLFSHKKHDDGEETKALLNAIFEKLNALEQGRSEKEKNKE